MSTMKHTPGPWRVERQNGSPTTGEWMIAGAKPGYLAEVRDCGSGCVKANASLIAAAPELLEALEEAVACGMVPISSATEGGAAKYSRQAQVADMIRAAIAKAKGES